MRDKTLAERFGRDEDLLQVDGREVRSLVRVPVTGGSRVTVTRLTATRARPQAVVLGVDHGEIAVHGVAASTVSLWSTTAPREVTLTVPKNATQLELWNAWLIDGVEHAWVGNAGLVLQKAGDTITMQCSDGLGNADFTDLVVQVVITS